MGTTNSMAKNKQSQLKSIPYDTIAVIGLGYVGLPLLLELAKKFKTIGFDIDKEKIKELQNNYDKTNECTEQDLKSTSALITNNSADITNAPIKIVTVPTPVDTSNTPDLTILKNASELIAKHIKKNDIIIYESTVYPGVTEDICAPIIESISGLKLNEDFFLAYSPERLSPGDTNRTLTKVVKVVSGSTPEVCDICANIYSKIISAGVHKTSSIKIAEASKVIENTQRDLNIAFMNELSIIFNKMNINTTEVIEAASTKWNFMKMTPGLVGGHCIGVDPYYLINKSKELGHLPNLILAARRINDGMGNYIAKEMIKLLVKAKLAIPNARIGIFGLTFKENVSDIRNSKVIDIIQELTDFQCTTLIHDPYAIPSDVKKEYNLTLTPLESMSDLDAIIIAVPHKPYQKMALDEFTQRIKHPTKVIYDIKSLLKDSTITPDIIYKSL